MSTARSVQSPMVAVPTTNVVDGVVGKQGCAVRAADGALSELETGGCECKHLVTSARLAAVVLLGCCEGDAGVDPCGALERDAILAQLLAQGAARSVPVTMITALASTLTGITVSTR